jgi:hypothetical protein
MHFRQIFSISAEFYVVQEIAKAVVGLESFNSILRQALVENQNRKQLLQYNLTAKMPPEGTFTLVSKTGMITLNKTSERI